MVRKLTTDDIDSYIAIRMDSLKLNPEAFGASLKSGVHKEQTKRSFQMHSDQNFILGNFEGDDLVGIIGFFRNKAPKRKHTATLWGMFVYPDHRRKKYGRALLDECLERAKSVAGVEIVNLRVVSANEEAVGLYETSGFVQEGIEKNALKDDRDYHDEILMALHLKN
jgi:RimJ/RimL family protein N-acetyltransferase